MQRLLLLGLNHLTAPLTVREKLGFNQDQLKSALLDLRSRWPHAEAVILSTCNRVELYLARPPHGSPRLEELAQFLANCHNIDPQMIQPHLYHKLEHDVVAHLFTVASSLDSMVIGETQILGQVRQAYDIAAQANSAGAMLHPLFQRAVAVGKQVLSETPLSQGRLSIATIAVDYAKQVFDQFADKTVLAIGAGKMAGLLLTNLAALSPGRLLICNRDLVKAESLASKFNGNAVPFEQLPQHLDQADILLTSTGSTQPILGRKDFEPAMRRRRYKPMFIIDIAIPRDIAADVADMPNVYLFNLDDLQHVATANRQGRNGAMEAAEKIVAKNVEEFVAWQRARQLGPMIDQLYQRWYELANQELMRTLGKFPNLSEQDKEHLEELARRVVNKILHDPIQMLREQSGSNHVPMTQYLHAMEKLFKLHADETLDNKPAEDSD